MHVGHRLTGSFMKYLRNKTSKIIFVYAAGALLLLVAAVLGVMLGASDMSFSDVLTAIFGASIDSPEARIIWYVRIPRVAGALVCGAALAVSGAVIQGVLANRLASPSIIGVNSGAALAVTVCAALGVAGGLRTSLFAFIGAFVTVVLVSLGAKKWGASRGTVILMGVAVNSLLGAISDTVITFSPNVGIASNDFRIGSFSSVTPSKLIPVAIAVIAALVVAFSLSNELDVLTLGEDNARGLGLNTGVTRLVFLLIAAVLAGSAVSICGLLSFVGLLVPHAVRRAVGTGARHLLPLSALFGAGFVALCDTLSRVVLAPYELPVGIILAFIGAPFFIFLLVNGKGGRTHA